MNVEVVDTMGRRWSRERNEEGEVEEGSFGMLRNLVSRRGRRGLIVRKILEERGGWMKRVWMVA